jgi:hypothetical protein
MGLRKLAISVVGSVKKMELEQQSQVVSNKYISVVIVLDIIQYLLNKLNNGRKGIN